MPSLRSSRFRIALLFALVGFNSLFRFVGDLRDDDVDGAVLVLLELSVGVLGVLAAWSTVVGRSWATLAILACGMAGALALLALPAHPPLPVDGIAGRGVIALAILAVAAVNAWYVRRLAASPLHVDAAESP